jgi:hypothetical protein
MVGVQDAAGLGHVEAILRPLAPWQLQHPVEVVANPALLGILLAGALQAVELALDFFANGVREGRLGDLLAVLRQRVAIGLAQLLFDRGELLAQVELALALFEALVDLDANLVLQRGFGQDGASPGDQRLEPRHDVALLEDGQVLVQLQLGRIAGHIGELARMLDAAQHLTDSRCAAQVEQVLEHGAVLAGELVRRGGQLVELGIWRRLDGHPQRAVAFDGGAGEQAAVLTAEDRCLASVWQAAGFLDVGDGADGGQVSVDARDDDHQAVGLTGGKDGGASALGFDGDRHGHVRQDDAVIQRQHGEDELGVVWHV